MLQQAIYVDITYNHSSDILFMSELRYVQEYQII